MTYYSDLSNYSYLEPSELALNVGWLSIKHPFFRRGKAGGDFLEKIQLLSLSPVNRSRGYHACEFCFFERHREITFEIHGKGMRLGSAELWIPSKGSFKYAAPNLISHYISRHSYLPPQEFIEAVMNAPSSSTLG
ncbi:DUF7919 family protein [Streptomyces lydicus]